MKKVRLIAVILTCAVLALSLSACVKHIVDTNGDEDFSIQTITDEKIVSGYKSYLAVGSVSTNVGNKHTLRVKKLSGVWQLGTVTVDNGSVEIKTDMSVTKGNCRLVLVYGNEIVYDFNINGTDTYATNATGKYDIKLVGESAVIRSLEYTFA